MFTECEGKIPRRWKEQYTTKIFISNYPIPPRVLESSFIVLNQLSDDEMKIPRLRDEEETEAPEMRKRRRG